MAFVLPIASLAMLAVAPALAEDPRSLNRWKTGVNLSGAELNPGRDRINFDYVVPTIAEIRHFRRQGLRVFRIPVLMERLFVISADGGQAMPSDDWRALVALIDDAATADAEIIVDFHQFGRTREGLIGRDAAATRSFVLAWASAAMALRDKPNVIFGLMNEPHEQTAAEWLGAANAAIAAIRKAGAKQLVLAPGSYWSGAHSWTVTDNAAVMKKLEDPADNFAYEVHQYLDGDSSGGSPNVTPGAGATRLAAFTEWARREKARGFLGEFGFSSSPQALAEARALVGYMARNRDVWLGWTYWAAGPWWGDYMFSIEPKDGRDKPQLNILLRYATAPN
ncbi:endoglucanase [Rhodoblastus acidophilus]|uniref:glycoside hydrolase family 5 protein n=1 Tax=Rhodoblastus acidophilus TaxID=1074 RepID=UPI00222511FE|nr:glycoside hydrolase family 5 protein [Rhodoblastus acidophilus]MCW2284553.1 endoglucanase [Rhodoblastus acidophilus]MCW2333506.1 endoglucanase [Rhodoblastus acidophilus]